MIQNENKYIFKSNETGHYVRVKGEWVPVKELIAKAKNWDKIRVIGAISQMVSCLDYVEQLENCLGDARRWIKKHPFYGEGGLEELEEILEVKTSS